MSVRDLYFLRTYRNFYTIIIARPTRELACHKRVGQSHVVISFGDEYAYTSWFALWRVFVVRHGWKSVVNSMPYRHIIGRLETTPPVLFWETPYWYIAGPVLITNSRYSKHCGAHNADSGGEAPGNEIMGGKGKGKGKEGSGMVGREGEKNK